MAPRRIRKGGNSEDFQLMFLGDVDSGGDGSTFESGDTVVWNEADEKFLPVPLPTSVDISQDVVDGLNAANAPSAVNPFVTDSDLGPANGLSQDIVNALNAGSSPSAPNPFITDSAADTLITAAVNAHKAQLFINVKDYGAVGDGLANDYAAIQAAITAAGAGQTVLFPAGHYTYGTTLDMDNKTGVRLLGAGSGMLDVDGASRLDYTGASTAINIRNSKACTIQDLDVAASQAGYNTTLINADGLTGTNTTELQILHCRLIVPSDAGVGSKIISLDGAVITNIVGCNFVNGARQVYGYGATFAYSIGMNILGCTFAGWSDYAIDNIGTSWLISGCVFQCYGNNAIHSATFEALNIVNNWFDDGVLSGKLIDLVYGQNARIAGNYLHTTSGTVTGISIGNSCTAISIVNNSIKILNVGIALGTGLLGLTVMSNWFTTCATEISGTYTAFDDVVVTGNSSATVVPFIKLRSPVDGGDHNMLMFQDPGVTGAASVHSIIAGRYGTNASTGGQIDFEFDASNDLSTAINLRVRNAAGTLGTASVFVDKDGNLGLNTKTQFGSGVGVIGMANAGTNPTGNPVNGGVLYVDGGALKYRSSTGLITIVGPATVQTYTVTNPSTDRAFDVSATSLAELAAVLGTLIADLKTAGVIG